MNTDKYYVVDKYGQYYEYSSFNELVDAFNFLGMRRIGNSFNDTYMSYSDYSYHYGDGKLPERLPVEYVVLDYLNRVVQVEEIKKAYALHIYDKELIQQRRKLDRYYWRARLGKNYLGFRNGPVPSTGKPSNRYGELLRKPKTTQEIRVNSCDSEGFARGRRGKGYLPNHWSDILRSNYNNKSWKNSKKKRQWE